MEARAAELARASVGCARGKVSLKEALTEMSRHPYRQFRRRFPRVPCGGERCRFKILFIADRPVDLPEGEGQVLNVSRGGLGMTASLRLPVHLSTLLRVRFTVQNHDFDACARLVWAATNPDGPGYRYGLRFWGSTPESLDQFYRRLDDLRINLLA